MRNSRIKKPKVKEIGKKKDIFLSLSVQLSIFMLSIFVIFIGLFIFNNTQMKSMVNTYTQYAKAQEVTTITRDIYTQAMKGFNNLLSALIFYGEDLTRYADESVSCTEVELWTVAFEEWSVTTTFIFGQNINFCYKVGVWVD